MLIIRILKNKKIVTGCLLPLGLLIFIFVIILFYNKEKNNLEIPINSIKSIELNRDGVIDGYDPATNSIIKGINVWSNYDASTRAFAGWQVEHGDTVYMIKREGDGVYIRNKNGDIGWITYFWIKEFREKEGVPKP